LVIINTSVQHGLLFADVIGQAEETAISLFGSGPVRLLSRKSVSLFFVPFSSGASPPLASPHPDEGGGMSEGG
jgi:hypothetical protein